MIAAMETVHNRLSDVGNAYRIYLLWLSNRFYFFKTRTLCSVSKKTIDYRIPSWNTAEAKRMFKNANKVNIELMQ